MSRILVIDDSNQQRVLARSVLEEAAFEVLEAEDGDRGLEMARCESLDCILLDWMMPGISGGDVLRALQEEGIAVPVIVVTVDPTHETRNECYRLGVADVIKKPRNPMDLLRAVEAVIDRPLS